MTEIGISLFRTLRDTMGDQLSLFKATKATLVDVSHTLEDQVLRNRLPSVIFTGFQESSHWREETARYLELAGIASQICIFAGGVPPVPEEQHIAVTLAPGDPLRQEWFLLVLTRDFSGLIAGLDRAEPVADEPDRLFDTFLSFNEAVVARAIATVLPLVDAARPDRAAELRAATAEFPPVAPSGARATAIISQIMSNVQVRYNAQQDVVAELRALRNEQERMMTVFTDLAVPVVPLLEGVIALPLIGSFDNRRAQLLMERLLQGIADQQAEVAIIDITGVSVIDTAVANALGQSIRAAQLLGAQIIVSGIRAEVAQTLVGLGVTLGNVTTVASLRAAVDAALEQQDRVIVPRGRL